MSKCTEFGTTYVLCWNKLWIPKTNKNDVTQCNSRVKFVVREYSAAIFCKYLQILFFLLVFFKGRTWGIWKFPAG